MLTSTVNLVRTKLMRYWGVSIETVCYVKISQLYHGGHKLKAAQKHYIWSPQAYILGIDLGTNILLHILLFWWALLKRWF